MKYNFTFPIPSSGIVADIQYIDILIMLSKIIHKGIAHGGLDDLTDGLTAVTGGSEQSAVVMQTTDEDTTDDAPQEHGNPTENGSLDGAVDGAGAGDGREVVAKKHGGLGGHVVHAVLHGMGGSSLGIIHAPLLRKPGAVGHITQEQAGETAEKNDERAQFVSS